MEVAVLAFAVVASLALGFSNLGTPSLWHDELIHAYVGKSIADTGTPALPSGVPYFSGTVFNFILAGVIKIWGMSEVALRTPSVLVAALNVVLAFIVVRPLLGSTTAVVSALVMAVTPWTVAWSHEARFYTLQQCFYLVMVIGFWRLCEGGDRKTMVTSGLLAAGAYTLGVMTSFHSIIFLGGIGGYAVTVWAMKRRWRSPESALVLAVGAAGLMTLVGLDVMMNNLDREAVLDRGGLGGGIVDASRSLRFYYFHWLYTNLGMGVFFLAILGYVLMLFREGRRGLFAALAFWAPILILTFFIGYRRPRFMFFLFPFYAAAVAYAGVVCAQWMRTPKRGWLERGMAVALVLVALRLGWTGVRLVGDSLEVAGGSNVTLARRHPEWRKACAYVKEHRGDAAILTTTYLPVLHYVGWVDNWYPAVDVWWEEDESGMAGLHDLEALQAFVAANPRGYFIAEWWRFERNIADRPWSDFSTDIAWVKANMVRVNEASTRDDVTVWAWGIE